MLSESIFNYLLFFSTLELNTHQKQEKNVPNANGKYNAFYQNVKERCDFF